MDKICVIIATNNAQKWIYKCLNSLKKSTVDINIIIIDNASIDDTVSIIKKEFTNIDLILSKTNLGFGNANNIGLKKAIEFNYDFVLLLNQDAYVKPNSIEILINRLKKNETFGVLSPIHLNGSEIKMDKYFYKYLIESSNSRQIITDYVCGNIKEVYEVDFANAAIWLISRDCLLSIGGFNPIFSHYGEDKEYINRLKYHNYKFGIVPQSFCIHDREERDDNADNINNNLKWLKIKYLVNTANINITTTLIRKNNRTLKFKVLKNIFKQLVYFKLKKTTSDIQYYLSLNDLYKKAMNSRKFTEKKGATFLVDEF